MDLAKQHEQFASKGDVAAVSERVRQNITRREFLDTINRQIVPPLKRIDENTK
jgi:hypothetical protein